MKNQKGFTLIEMLIVLTIISTLLILLIPNLAGKNEDIEDKGCEALLQMAESQLLSYKIDNGTTPTNLEVLVDDKYLKTDTCANGKQRVQLSDDEDKVVELINVN